MIRTTSPSLPIRMKALGANDTPAVVSAASASPIEGRTVKPMRRPPPTAALTLRKRRRERSTPSLSAISTSRLEFISGFLLVACHNVRGALDSFADSRIRAAATDVSGHGGVDVAVGWIGVGGEQGRRRHDLARLAIAALRHLQLDPGLLNPLAGRRGANSLDRGDALTGNCRDGRDARAHGHALEVDRAGAAQATAATEFRSAHTKDIAQHPEHGCVKVDVDPAGDSVNVDCIGHQSLLTLVSWGKRSACHYSTQAPKLLPNMGSPLFESAREASS